MTPSSGKKAFARVEKTTIEDLDGEPLAGWKIVAPWGEFEYELEESARRECSDINASYEKAVSAAVREGVREFAERAANILEVESNARMSDKHIRPLSLKDMADGIRALAQEVK